MKPVLFFLAFLLIVCSAQTSRALPGLSISPSQYDLGSHNPNSSNWNVQFTVTLFDYSGPVTNNVTFVVHQGGPGVIAPNSTVTPPINGTFILGPTDTSITLQYAFTFPATYGFFQGSIWFENQYDSSQVFTSYIYYGIVVPPVGVSDYVQLMSSAGVGPGTFSPTTGSPIPASCTLSFCPINYSAKFFDLGSPTTVSSWTWKIQLYHSKGAYTLSLPPPFSGSTYSDLHINSAFTLPPNDWYRDANGNILAKVQVDSMDSDGFGHHAERLVGVKYPPNKTSGTLLCANGTPLANKPVTVEWWDSIGMLASQTTTTNSVGHFDVAISCASANHTNGRLVISSPGCTKWTIPANECWGIVGPLVCKECGGCTPAPAGLVDWWTFDEKAAGNMAGDIAQYANQVTLSNGPTPGTGKVAGDLCFDGQNDFGSVADHPEINFSGDCRNDAAEAFTIDTWVKTTGAGLEVILDKREKQGVNFLRGYSLFIQNGRLGFQMATGPGVFVCNLPNAACSNDLSPASVHLNDGQWHFIAVTISRCRGAVGRMYVDGNLVLTFTPKIGDISNRVPLLIGRSYPIPVDNYFKGCLDELEFFKTVLSKTELDSVYHAGAAGKCKPAGPIKIDRKN